jgi:hypothetical protein
MKVTASVHKFSTRYFQQPRHKLKIGLVMSCAVADIDGAITNEMICVLVYLSTLRLGNYDCTQCSLMPMPIALLALMPIISIFLVMQMGITQIWCHQRVPGSWASSVQYAHACMGRLLVLIQLAAQSSSMVGKDLLQGCAEVIGEISSGPRPVLLRWFPFARLDPQRPLPW